MSIIIPANSAVGGGYAVDNSIRMSGSTVNLQKNFSGDGNRKTWTYSTWFKLSKITQSGFFNWGKGNPEFSLRFESASSNTANNYFRVSQFDGSQPIDLVTDQFFADPSAWGHMVVAFDTTQGTASNRIKIYFNGTQITSFSTETYPSVNFDTFVNQSSKINYLAYADYEPINGYLSETVFIDGQQLAPTSFGEFDEDSGIWKPIDVSGLTFGTNGFYLDYGNSGALGADVSGNTNNFTVNNLTAIDQSTDTCTNNFCTLNPLTKRSGGTLTEGNLQYTASTADSSIFGTMAIPPGMKVYFEVKLVSNTAQNSIGIHSLYDGGDGAFVKGGSETGTYSFKPRGSGSVTQYFNNGSSTNTSIDNPANDTILGVAIDNANGQIHYHIAGTYINSSDPTDNDPVALVTGFGGATEQYLHFSLDTTTTQPSNQFNFGSPPYSESGGNSDGNGYGNFNQAVPSGYYALNTKNLAEYG